MLPPSEIQLLILIAIAVLYAAFDVFNKRNVPDVFAYASIMVGLAVAAVYNSQMFLFDLAIAGIIAIVGYAIYRVGMWGAGDYFELTAISLMLPLQPAPLLVSIYQLGLPFIISVFIATGFAAIWVVPGYYLLFVRRKWKKKPDKEHVLYGLGLLVLYFALFTVVYFFYGFTTGRVALIFLVAIPSSITLLFEEEITERMIELVGVKQLEEGDIIAFNMMSAADHRYFSRYRGFGRLVTRSLIARLRNAKRKLPVYKNAAPLAVFILIGTVISLLFGNVVLFMT